MSCYDSIWSLPNRWLPRARGAETRSDVMEAARGGPSSIFKAWKIQQNWGRTVITQYPRRIWGSCANLMSVPLLWESQIAIGGLVERLFPPHPVCHQPTSSHCPLLSYLRGPMLCNKLSSFLFVTIARWNVGTVVESSFD